MRPPFVRLSRLEAMEDEFIAAAVRHQHILEGLGLVIQLLQRQVRALEEKLATHGVVQ